MILDKINLNQIRVFEVVYRLGSMTEAARELHLTQSGISQHIKSMEDSLRVSLFERFQKRLIPSQAAREIYEDCRAALEAIEETLQRLVGEKKLISGVVRIAFPSEFGKNIAIPKLYEVIVPYPEIKLSFVTSYTLEAEALLLKGEVDLAMIDDMVVDSRIEKVQIFEEPFDLCAAPHYIASLGTKVEHTANFFSKLDYVDYHEKGEILGKWFQFHLGKIPRTRIRATVEDAQGVAQLILNGYGAGIIPQHLIQRMKKSGNELYIFSGKKQPPTNRIFLAWLRGRTLPKPTKLVQQQLLKNQIEANWE